MPLCSAPRQGVRADPASLKGLTSLPLAHGHRPGISPPPLPTPVCRYDLEYNLQTNVQLQPLALLSSLQAKVRTYELKLQQQKRRLRELGAEDLSDDDQTPESAQKLDVTPAPPAPEGAKDGD